MANILMVVPPERFRDEELFLTRAELESAGHGITIASTRQGRLRGSRGGHVQAERLLCDLDAGRFDAVVFVGGGGSTLLFEDPDAIRIAREMYEQKHPVAAICLAPVILANAGILKGKKATIAGTKAKMIEAKGATYTGPGVTVDGRIVTANAPKASKEFGRKLNELLVKE